MKYQIILTDLEDTQYVVARLSSWEDAKAKFEFFKVAIVTPNTLVKTLDFRSIELSRMKPVATYFGSNELCRLEPLEKHQRRDEKL